MAESLYAPQRLAHVKLRFEYDTRQNRTLLPALPGNAELVRMTVMCICYHFQFHNSLFNLFDLWTDNWLDRVQLLTYSCPMGSVCEPILLQSY